MKDKKYLMDYANELLEKAFIPTVLGLLSLPVIVAVIVQFLIGGNQ